jgi:trimeric autotransporter adhesin
MPNADNEPQIPKNQSPITDDRTGMVSRDWYRFFLNLLNKANQGGGGGGTGTVTSVNVSGGTTGLTTSGGPVTTSGTITLAGTLDVDNGGTGQTTAAAAITALTGTQTSGYYLRSNGTNAALSAIQVADVPTLNQNTTGQAGSVANALTAGTGISYSVGTTYNGSVAVTIDNSAPDQVVSLTGGTGISTSGTYPSFTITNTAPDQVVSLTGGTGISTSGTYPSFTVTNTAPDQVVSIAAGTGMSVTGTYPSFTVTNTAPDQIVSLTGAGTTSVTGTYPNFTITSNDQYVGTVTSVSGTGTVNGISLTGTVTSSGSLTLGGTLTGVDLTTQVTGTLPIANGGTGQTTAVAAFDALAPTTTKGDLIVSNGTDNVRLPVGTDNYVLTADSAQASGVKWALATGSGATITNDTSTSTNVYPTFAAATSGALSTIYTSNAKYLYKPSTGELTSEHFIAGNGIFVNNLTIDVSYTIAAGTSGMSAGPVTVASGTTVTVASGSRWVVM